MTTAAVYLVAALLIAVAALNLEGDNSYSCMRIKMNKAVAALNLEGDNSTERYQCEHEELWLP